MLRAVEMVGVRQRNPPRRDYERTERSQVCKDRNCHDHPKRELKRASVYNHESVNLSRIIKKNPYGSGC